jgi:hypothetical protein
MVWVGSCGMALWKIRNKMAIEKKLILSPAIISYNIISLMPHWIELLSGKEQGLIKMVQAWIRRTMTMVVVK